MSSDIRLIRYKKYLFFLEYRGLIKFLIIFIYLWKPQSIILNILPEWLGKSQENFHTFYSGLIYPEMVLNLLPSKDNLSKISGDH